MTAYQVIKGFLRGGVVSEVFAADVDMPAMAAQIDAHQAGSAGMGIASHRVHEGASSGCDVRNRSVNLEAAFTCFPTFASLSSAAPVRLFYSNPALADGGSHLPVCSPLLPAGARLAGFFEVTA